MQSAGRSGKAAINSNTAGAVSDEQFRASFEAVPDTRIETFKDLTIECQKYSAILENLNNDWTKRIKALQMLRSLLKQDDRFCSAFSEQAYSLIGNALELSAKDLRSQVCREACITIAYFCEKLGTGFWRVAEAILPITMNLTQNSAKVMSTSGQICNAYIAMYVHHPKVLSIVVHQISHKSKEVRRASIALVSIIINLWDPTMVEKHSAELLQTIKLALCDADPEARANGRQAYESLQNHYPNKAEILFQELEPSKQRMLVDRSSTASSTHSINSERDNLPNPNRGLYNVQSSFLNKRSASDLNHSVRRLNLVPPRIAHRPNIKTTTGKPPQVSPPTHKILPSTPLSKKNPPIAPNVNLGKLQKSASITSAAAAAASKAASQPGSRSTSPNRHRQPQHHVQQSRSNIQAPTTKKIINGGNMAITNTPLKSALPSHRELAQGVSRALKNVDIQSRRPNVIRNDDHTKSSNVNHHPSRLSNSPQDFYGLSQKQEAALNRINSSEDYGIEMSGVKKKISTNSNSSAKQITSDEYENSNNKWSYLNAETLSSNQQQQGEFIQEICDILSDREANEREVEISLQLLTRMIREGGINLWDDYFNNIFFAIQQVISYQPAGCITAKILALKGMKELCIAQPKRLVTKTELLLMNILNAHESDDATVVRAAEDCGSALASRLPTNTCMNLLLTVIDDENSRYHQLSGAIKMLSSVISKLPVDEVEKILPAVASRMTRCYENSQSMVRRASIICLVSIGNAIGIDTLKPHLNPSTLKLVEVYAARMTKKDNNGS